MAQKPATVIVRRRRKGVVVRETRVSADGSRDVKDRLEAGIRDTHAGDRLEAANKNVKNALESGELPMSTLVLRSEQQLILEKFDEYMDLSLGLIRSGRIPRWARVIAPPRLGKSVVMGGCVAAAKASTVILTTTKALVEQMVGDLREQLPTVHVGAYYGEVKNPRLHGITVTTYAIAQRHHTEGILPDAIRRATLVFCDEGHKSMTAKRQAMLREAFESTALRIAFTATPDYDSERALVNYFPHLIHEITMQEAVELDRLAEAEVEIHAIDVDGSVVTLKRGDFDEDMLGRVMGKAPFFEAARVIRYEVEDNIGIPAIICCTDRKQASDLWAYLREHRPKDRPPPVLILGNMSNKRRRQALDQFKTGALDTIIQVGVLIEGWNSPRCKLMIDMAPTISMVRAKQKFFRVMTKDGDALAKIYMLLPWGLPQLPITPGELFGESITFTDTDHWLDQFGFKKEHRYAGNKVRLPARTPVRKVELKSHVVHTSRLKRIALKASDKDQVRRVILSGIEDPSSHLPHYGGFNGTSFEHPLFSGTGQRLMRMCGIRPNARDYVRWMIDLFPGVDSHELAHRTKSAQGTIDVHTQYDMDLIDPLNPEGRDWTHKQREGWVESQRAYQPAEVPDPEEALGMKQVLEIFHEAFRLLSSRQQFVLQMRYGLYGEEEHSYADIGRAIDRTGTQAATVGRKALRRLSYYMRKIMSERLMDENLMKEAHNSFWKLLD